MSQFYCRQLKLLFFLSLLIFKSSTLFKKILLKHSLSAQPHRALTFPIETNPAAMIYTPPNVCLVMV